jgi:hypothetical protein
MTGSPAEEEAGVFVALDGTIASAWEEPSEGANTRRSYVPQSSTAAALSSELEVVP